jgi:hypothetical protein
MKYLLSFLTGLLLGVVAAAATIYFNPLTRAQSLPANNAGWVLEYSLDPAGNWLTTHDRELPLRVMPEDVPLLWEGGIRDSLLVALPLSDESGGPGAAATRISVPSPATEFLRTGLLVDDYWLISTPDEGSVFVHTLSNLWPLVRDTTVRVDWLRRDWSGPGVYGPTRGPAGSGAELVGVSGRFAGQKGRGRERLTLDSYSPGTGLASLKGQLLLEMDGATP